MHAKPGFTGTVVVYDGDREIGRNQVQGAAEGWWVDLAAGVPGRVGRVVLLAQDGSVLDEEPVSLQHSPPPYCG